MCWKYIKYFNEKEFACPCCGQVEMNENFIFKLDSIRELADVAMPVSSGWRCYKHNLSVGGKPTSSHRFGYAVDIRVASSRTRYLLLEAALKLGIPRIGLGKDFIHLDVDPNKPGSLIWTYYY